MKFKAPKIDYNDDWHKCRKPLLWWNFIQPLGLIWTCKCGKTWRKEPDYGRDTKWKRYHGGR